MATAPTIKQRCDQLNQTFETILTHPESDSRYVHFDSSGLATSACKKDASSFRQVANQVKELLNSSWEELKEPQKERLAVQYIQLVEIRNKSINTFNPRTGFKGLLDKVAATWRAFLRSILLINVCVYTTRQKCLSTDQSTELAVEHKIYNYLPSGCTEEEKVQFTGHALTLFRGIQPNCIPTVLTHLQKTPFEKMDSFTKHAHDALMCKSPVDPEDTDVILNLINLILIQTPEVEYIYLHYDRDVRRNMLRNMLRILNQVPPEARTELLQINEENPSFLEAIPDIFFEEYDSKIIQNLLKIQKFVYFDEKTAQYFGKIPKEDRANMIECGLKLAQEVKDIYLYSLFDILKYLQDAPQEARTEIVEDIISHQKDLNSLIIGASVFSRGFFKIIIPSKIPEDKRREFANKVEEQLKANRSANEYETVTQLAKSY